MTHCSYNMYSYAAPIASYETYYNYLYQTQVFIHPMLPALTLQAFAVSADHYFFTFSVSHLSPTYL
jgi:hypothetical protein